MGKRFFFISYFCKHRGKCHTIVGCALLALPFLIGGIEIYLSTFYGALSHLLADYVAGKLPGRRPFSIKWW